MDRGPRQSDQIRSATLSSSGAVGRRVPETHSTSLSHNSGVALFIGFLGRDTA
jgi:hypothetical protein